MGPNVAPDERSDGIGGSEIAEALSEAPYGCARRLVYKKRGVPPDYPDDAPLVKLRGTELEPLIVARYLRTEREKGRTLKAVRRARARHPSIPWATLSVDREILGDPRGVGVFEGKSHNVWIFAKYRREGLPASHILQMCWYLWGRRRPWGAYGVLCPDSWQFLTFEIERNDDLIDAIFPHIEAVWRKIENGPLPDPLDPSDRRCQRCEWRRTCHGAELVAVAPAGERGELPVDESFADLVADWQEAHDLAEDAATTEEAIRDVMRERIVANDWPGVACRGYRVHYRESVQRRVDTKLLRARYPAIATEVERAIAIRPLRIYAT